MASFVQFLEHSGVYAAQSFMIVPWGGFNLVCLRDSKDVRLSYDRGRLQVENVSLEQVEQVAHEYINARFREQGGQERVDQLLRLRTALYATARPGGPARGLKVSGKGGHISELIANNGPKLDVAILPRKDYKIAFKFLKHFDQSGKVINATIRTPEDVPWFLYQAELDIRCSGEYLFYCGRCHMDHRPERPTTKNPARCFSKRYRTI